jgi:WD40 repeat protein
MGVGIVEMLMRCNILALVGGGVLPKFAKNKVIIWDDYQNHAIAELEFAHDVKGVKIRREMFVPPISFHISSKSINHSHSHHSLTRHRVVTVLETEVHVYHFNNLNVLTSLYTVANPLGLCALSGMGAVVLGCPGTKLGVLHIERIDPAAGAAGAAGAGPGSNSLAVTAHKNALLCIGVSPDGALIATASERGTLVRVFETGAGKLVREFRRGTKAADINSVNFSQDNTLIVATSSSGTIHVFDLASPEQQASAASQK